MATKKINELTALSGSPASDDVLPIWDSSGGVTRKVPFSDLTPLPSGAVSGQELVATGASSYDWRYPHYPLAGTAPEQLTGGGPAYDWDAGDLAVADLTQITSWTDRVGGQVLATGSGTVRYSHHSPHISNVPVVECKASYLSNANVTFSSQSFTIALVFFTAERGTTNSVLGMGAAAFVNCNVNGYAQLFDPQNAAHALGGRFDAPLPTVLIIRGNAVGSKVLANDTEGSNAALALKTYTTLKVGAAGDGSLAWTGQIAKLCIWNRDLSDAEAVALSRHLSSKYRVSPSARIDLPLVACVGDSNTYGSFITALGDEYPNKLRIALQNSVTVFNLAYPGYSAVSLNDEIATRYTPLLNTKRSHNILVTMIGTIADASRYANLTTFLTTAQAAGWTRIVCTIPDCVSSFLAVADRNTYNASIRTNAFSIAEGFADIAADYRIGRTGASADSIYFQDDQIHMKGAANTIIAEHVASAIRQQMGFWPNTFPWTSTDNTTNVARQIPLQNGRQYVIQVLATARRMDSGTEYSYHKRSYIAFVTGGAITLTEAETDVNTYATLSTATIDLNASGLLLQIRATGESGKTLQWSIWVNIIGTTL